jgi:uncharacterized protein YigE (DUF2233 family)
MKHCPPNVCYNPRLLTIMLAALVLLAGCGQRTATPAPRPTIAVPTLFPTAAISAPSPAPTPPAAAAPPDSGWIAGDSGIAVRRLRVPAAPGQPAIPILVVRIDPATARLRVAYAPDQPRAIRSWFAEEQPLLAVNGSFFTQQYQSTALVISDGHASGPSYEGFGGMLAVAPDGSVSLRALRDQPYDSAETLDQAMQSFPMLVFPGGVPAGIEDDNERARRTAVALDREGFLLLIISPTSAFTLRGLADWLTQSDLHIEQALNLDGGSSTGLYLKAGPLNEQIDSLGLLPIVLLVEPK